MTDRWKGVEDTLEKYMTLVANDALDAAAKLAEELIMQGKSDEIPMAIRFLKDKP